MAGRAGVRARPRHSGAVKVGPHARHQAVKAEPARTAKGLVAVCFRRRAVGASAHTAARRAEPPRAVPAAIALRARAAPLKKLRRLPGTDAERARRVQDCRSPPASSTLHVAHGTWHFSARGRATTFDKTSTCQGDNYCQDVAAR